MKLQEWIDGFEIFKKYEKGECCLVLGEHDVVYIGIDPAIVHPDDIKALEALGFHADFDYLENFYHYT